MIDQSLTSSVCLWKRLLRGADLLDEVSIQQEDAQWQPVHAGRISRSRGGERIKTYPAVRPGSYSSYKRLRSRRL